MAGPTDDERILFDDEGILVQCVLTTIYPGIFLTGYDSSLDQEAFNLLRWPNITTIGFDEHGLMMGEDIINGARILVQQVEATSVDALLDGPLPYAA